MIETSVNDVGDNLHVSMAVLTKSSVSIERNPVGEKERCLGISASNIVESSSHESHVRLDKIIIHYAEVPKVGIAMAVVLGEAKMEA